MQMGKTKCGSILTKTSSLETLPCLSRVFKTVILTVGVTMVVVICLLIYLYALSSTILFRASSRQRNRDRWQNSLPPSPAFPLPRSGAASCHQVEQQPKIYSIL